MAIIFDSIGSFHFNESGVASSFESTLENVNVVTDYVTDYLAANGVSLKVVPAICIAIDEIFSNIVKYGYNGSKGIVDIAVKIDKDNKAIALAFKDYSPKFNPLVDAKVNSNFDIPTEERSVGGLGLLIVTKSMDYVEYRYEEGNVLILVKRY